MKYILRNPLEGYKRCTCSLCTRELSHVLQNGRKLCWFRSWASFRSRNREGLISANDLRRAIKGMQVEGKPNYLFSNHMSWRHQRWCRSAPLPSDLRRNGRGRSIFTSPWEPSRERVSCTDLPRDLHARDGWWLRVGAAYAFNERVGITSLSRAVVLDRIWMTISITNEASKYLNLFQTMLRMLN